MSIRSSRNDGGTQWRETDSMSAIRKGFEPVRPAPRALHAAGSMLLVAAVLASELCRMALYAVMVLLEPLLRIVLIPLAYLGFLVTLLFGFLIGDPNFPKWGMLAFSVGSLCAYWLYLGLMALVIGGGRGRD